MARRKRAGKRRGRNEGSVYQRQSDGRWVATLIVGLTDAGKPKRRVFYGVTQAEALAKRDDYKAKLTLGHVQLDADAKRTVAQYLDAWFAALRVKRTTRRRYGQLIEYRIKPYLGPYPLEKLAQRKVGPQIIKHWLGWLQELDAGPPPAKARKDPGRGGPAGAERGEGQSDGGAGADGTKKKVSERGQEMALRVLNKALSDAEAEDLIGVNPLRKVKSGRPRPPAPETRAMTLEQVGLFFQAAQGSAYYALYVLALDSGMREGELFALEWGDLDLVAGTLKVQRELAELDGVVTVEEPKTKGSRRLVQLTDHTVAVLRAYREERLRAGFDGPLVFTAPEGGYLRRPNLAQRSFRPILKRAGLPRFKFHELRHTCATLLLMTETPIKVVSERLGHASVQVTLKTYAHVQPGMQKHAAQKMASLLAGALQSARKTAADAGPAHGGDKGEQAGAVRLLDAVLEQALPGGGK
jgi:integrase